MRLFSAFVALVAALGMFAGGMAPVVADLKSPDDVYTFQFLSQVLMQFAAVCAAFVSGQLFRTSPLLRKALEVSRDE